MGGAALSEAVARRPLVVKEVMGAEDFAFTVIGKAGTIRVLFGPDGGALGPDATALLEKGTGDVAVTTLAAATTTLAEAGTGVAALGTGASASATDGFESIGGVGPGAGETVEIGVTLLPTIDSWARSLTGSSLGA